LETARDALINGVDARYDRQEHGGAGTQIDVPPERQFIGWDAYKKAIDSGADVAIMATTPHFRPMQFEYAVQQGLHAFIEKPVAVDAPGVRQVLAAAQAAKQNNTKVAAGFQRFHNPMYQEAIGRIQDNAIGGLTYLRTYFNHGTMWDIPRKPEWNEMEFQMRNWQHFCWTSGDHTCEQQAHSFQIIYWLLGRPPLKAVGMGGREVCKGARYGDIFDHHAVEFTYDDGLTVFAQDRQINGCWTEMAEAIHGTDGWCRIQQNDNATIQGAHPWSYPGRGINAYQLEQNAFIDAIVNDKPYNEGEMAAMSCMLSVMTRMATYSAQEVTWEKAFQSQVRLGPDTYAWDADPPVQPGPDGTYEHAVPVPGRWNNY